MTASLTSDSFSGLACACTGHGCCGKDGHGRSGHRLRLLYIATFSRGQVMLEGNIGVGQTTLLRAIGRTLGGGCERIEGTIDLMPSDLVYHTFVDENGNPQVAPGPLLQHGGALATFF